MHYEVAKIQATIATEVLCAIITSLGTSCRKRCSLTIILYRSRWADFFVCLCVLKPKHAKIHIGVNCQGWKGLAERSGQIGELGNRQQYEV